ncbi:3-phosphoshikimate 1-carboxyvinyltransferase [Lacinutrix iliipiscaria]|uniref:3-phosphoshikimate 1-carboxyvinyltransferase n=1 Tax=Lacinutrix iliipiscaria TaxID=1230532 RepID=A0ABW5WJH4_9FLAO
MNIKLHLSKVKNQKPVIQITGSKSESNRLLLLQALYPEIEIKNASNSDDSKVMIKALGSKSDTIDVHHAGTAMRFLTAYFSIQEGRSVTLCGSSRMHERPIQILVNALIQLGAKITYLENDGFPPLKIKGKALTKNKVTLKAHVSSQYISALLLIASKLENGLELTLEGEITSMPYIKMTLSLLDEIGIKSTFHKNRITIKPNNQALNTKTLTVESDWSSASYYYSIVALSDIDTEIRLTAYKARSLQGDSVLADIYKAFGVQTTFKNNTITLKKEAPASSYIKLDLNNSPDIAQTIAVTCLGLGLACQLSGLHTLKIKETDRLMALKNEIEKLGGHIQITEDSLQLEATNKINANINIATYQDHRMAMAFAPLALKTPIVIEEASVVSKSYPSFWDDLKHIGFKISK